mmetsp:Transcript_56251/g.150575  ORF Transcript_56251/g.150575 Transcript_56251/m.150575 type:complete len:255 (+) Transcript_56251:2007-2771(+)
MRPEQAQLGHRLERALASLAQRPERKGQESCRDGETAAGDGREQGGDLGCPRLHSEPLTEDVGALRIQERHPEPDKVHEREDLRVVVHVQPEDHDDKDHAVEHADPEDVGRRDLRDAAREEAEHDPDIYGAQEGAEDAIPCIRQGLARGLPEREDEERDGAHRPEARLLELLEPREDGLGQDERQPGDQRKSGTTHRELRVVSKGPVPVLQEHLVHKAVLRLAPPQRRYLAAQPRAGRVLAEGVVHVGAGARSA